MHLVFLCLYVRTPLFWLAPEDASLPKPMAVEGRARNLVSHGCHRDCYFPTSCSPPSETRVIPRFDTVMKRLTVSPNNQNVYSTLALRLFVETSGQPLLLHGRVLGPDQGTQTHSVLKAQLSSCPSLAPDALSFDICVWFICWLFLGVVSGPSQYLILCATLSGILVEIRFPGPIL